MFIKRNWEDQVKMKEINIYIIIVHAVSGTKHEEFKINRWR